MKKLIRICCVIMLMAALVTPVYAAEKALTAAADGEKKADEPSSQDEGEILTTGADDSEEPGQNPLPFELEAPKYVFADIVSAEEGAQEINVAFSKNEDMKAFFGLDKEAKDITVRSVGIMTLNASAQIDWAIDDPEAWHADTAWDTDGKNAKGDKIVGDWAYVGIALDGNRQQSVRIFPEFGNPKSKDNKAWNGSGSIKGWKDILPADVLKEYGDTYYVDWTEHTLYIRVRYYIFTIDNDEGVARNTYITKWSETVAVGKDAETYAPYAMESDIPVPTISNLVVDSSDDTIGTVFTFDAAVPADFEKNALRTEVYGGIGHLVYCVRLHQDGEWKVCYTDAVSQTVVVPMKDVLGENEVYNEGDAVEVYAFCGSISMTELTGRGSAAWAELIPTRWHTESRSPILRPNRRPSLPENPHPRRRRSLRKKERIQTTRSRIIRFRPRRFRTIKRKKSARYVISTLIRSSSDSACSTGSAER